MTKIRVRSKINIWETVEKVCQNLNNESENKIQSFWSI